MFYDSPLGKLFHGHGPLKAALRPSDMVHIALNAGEVDTELKGGFRAHGLHEFYTAADGANFAPIGFALLLGQLGQDALRGNLLWVREEKAARQGGHPYGPGLAELGVDTSMITLLLLPDAKAVLRAALDCARDAAVAAVVIDLAGRQPLLDLTATRRFTLAAAEKRTMVLIARSGAKPTPSAAHSRWHVGTAPSRALEAHAPGPPAFALELLRQRGGRDGLKITVEWDRDSASFRLRDDAATAPPLSCPASAVAFGRAGDSVRSRAA